MNYYAQQIRDVLDAEKEEFINIKISSCSVDVSSKVLTIPKKYLVALHNDILADGYE